VGNGNHCIARDGLLGDLHHPLHVRSEYPDESGSLIDLAGIKDGRNRPTPGDTFSSSKPMSNPQKRPALTKPTCTATGTGSPMAWRPAGAPLSLDVASY
jgi:hypothetical protein